jgi:D-alanine transaminase
MALTAANRRLTLTICFNYGGRAEIVDAVRQLVADGVLATRQADQAILRGVTRSTLLDVVAAEGLRFQERPFTRDEAYGAREAFLSSATTIATPVVAIDGRPIGPGTPGSITRRLMEAFHKHVKE